MDKSNYALITALYDTQASDFYKDIYFPAIKYGLFLLYNKQVDITNYYIVENVQNEINECFGIKIPLIVIKQTIKFISNNHSDFTVELLSNGDQFAIKKAWDKTIVDSIEYRYEQNKISFSKLEDLFCRYLTIQHIQTDKTFLCFFSENTEEIFNYINNENDSCVRINEEYIHIINFLKWIKNEDVELYNIASDIFWGSIIAAFLKRETDINIKPVNQVSYYFDSSLVLSLLDLDSQANNQYSKELVGIIQASGNLPYVHPLIIREVNSILYSVERDKVPKPNSGIAEAYYRRDLTPSKILQIRQSLRSLISDAGLYIENTSDAQLDEIQKNYKNKSSVISLSETRQNSYSDNIRDIHDVFMLDFISKKQAKCVSIEKCNHFFVSLNKDLISHFKGTTISATISPIIHPSRIVMDLWIHNSKTTLIRKEALTEVIARCTALNQTDVRRKLKLISRYYKTEEFTEERYKAVYLALMDRSKEVLSGIDAITASETDLEKAHQYAEAIIQTSVKLEEERREAHVDLQKRFDELKEIVTKDRKEREERDIAKETYLNLIEKKASIQEQLLKISPHLLELEKQREKSINMWLYWISIILQTMCFIAILIFGIKFIISGVGSENSFSDIINNINAGLIVSIAFAIVIGIASGLMDLSIFTPRKAYKNKKQRQIDVWNNESVEYQSLIRKQESLISNISHIQEEIDSYNKTR